MKNGEKLVYMKKREEVSAVPTPRITRRAVIDRKSEDLYLTLPKFQSTPDTIHFDNPSFEGLPSAGRIPNGWKDAIASGSNSPPDTQPGNYNVSLPAADGNTYLGMVCRDNGTFESVSQKLKYPLDTNHVYAFHIYLACSDSHVSFSQTIQKLANFTALIGLKVYGMNSVTNTPFLLTVLPQATNHWTKYLIPLVPEQPVETIIFEAFNPHSINVNGNILLDHCSPILRVKD
jgi:hypothetical protein